MTKKTILSSKAYFESALLIEKTIEVAKLTLMQSLFEELERQMDDMVQALPFALSRLDDAYCYYYKECLDAYYGKRQPSYPAIAYAFDEIKFKDNKKLLLHITVGEHLYAGLVLYDLDKCEDICDISLTEENTIKAYLKVSNTDADFDFGYLSDLNGEDDLSDDLVPNFKTMQGVVTSLVEEVALTAFVEKSVQKIREKLMEIVIQ